MNKWGFKVLIGVLFVTLAFGGMAMAQTTKQATEPAKAAAKKSMDMAIIVVDLQGDFTKAKKGSLAVEGTDDAYVKSVADATAKLKAAGFPSTRPRTGIPRIMPPLPPITRGKSLLT